MAMGRPVIDLDKAISIAQNIPTRSELCKRHRIAYNLLRKHQLLDDIYVYEQRGQRCTKYLVGQPVLPQEWYTPLLEIIR